MAVQVELEPWLEDQHLLGEPLVSRWRRRLAEVGLVLGSGEVRVRVDGRALLLPADTLVGLGEDEILALAAPGDRFRVVAVGTRSGGSLDVLDAEAWRALSRGPGRLAEAPAVFADDLSSLHAIERLEAADTALAAIRTCRVVGSRSSLTIAATVTLDPGCTIWGGVTLLGDTRIAAGATLHPGCHLTDCIVEAGATLLPYTVAEGAHIGPDVTVGPFAHLRAGTRLEAGSKVGNFVETKKTTLGPGAKANHLAYLGDAMVGARTNVGAGTITCNYDGARKHRTVLGDGVFVGTNSSLVAPLTVGDGALIAAGSVITDDVAPGDLALGRARQSLKPGRGAEILAANQRAKDEESGS